MENENKKFYLSEFSYFDGEYDVTFNILDVNFDRKTITVAISRCGKITQDTFDLMRDKDGKLYFEYGKFYENKISIDDFEDLTMTNEEYISILKQDFPKDFADDDEFTAALLDLCENVKENDK